MPAVRTRGVDGEARGLAQTGDAIGCDAGTSQALTPGLRRPGRELIWRDALAGRRGLLDPGPEVGRAQLREREQQVAHVALGVDDQAGDAAQQRVLEQVDAQAGLAGTGHAHDHAVGGEVGRVHAERSVGIEPVSDEELVGVDAGHASLTSGRRPRTLAPGAPNLPHRGGGVVDIRRRR